ncbi:unnamed protein product [Rotaria magnacalcarata]|uniref:Nucleoplasmin core domain-containing protein n=3 Tax=Rotaria magnacalcarata TaxID=392030 RepID=A0A816MCC7_9BILA|nr:unnamed protein product [Rotaria magnacalcarata]CAF1990303.1 unnamed protein product [Rotaria magnacalcarata]CAF2113165.1 unnamed protein product [Rotaria magnacalcarata]CAF2118839.1 unnamed protein product [Rotaria magnacalcarata]
MREQMVLDEKTIGVELSASKKQFKWPVHDTDKKSKDHDKDDDESEDETSALQTILVVHSAVLGVGAKTDQRNLVHLTIKDASGNKIILDQPILSLSLNKNDSITAFNLRILLTETTEVTFKLVEGDGPVHLITSKILEPPFDFGGYSSDDEDDQFDVMSGTSDEDIQQSAGDRKNPMNPTGKASKKAKKQQLGSNNSNSNNNSASEFQQQKKKRKKDD